MAGDALKPVTVIGPMDVPADVPEDIAANLKGCSIMLRLLIAAKVHAPNDLGGKVPAHVTISDESLGWIPRAPLCVFMRAKTPEAPTNLTIEICAVCRRYRFVSEGVTTPKAGPMARPGGACKLTMGCEGRMYVAHAASV